MDTEVVDGFYVTPISDGSFLVTITENLETGVGRVFPLGMGGWWVALHAERPPLTDLYTTDEIAAMYSADTEGFTRDYLRPREAPDVAGWGRSRDQAISSLRSELSDDESPDRFM